MGTEEKGFVTCIPFGGFRGILDFRIYMQKFMCMYVHFSGEISITFHQIFKKKDTNMVKNQHLVEYVSL